ncbi:STAS domain-containing protein [Nocardia sp. NPDC050712]|uniref:STAS domain-containing protein n=1 Tax=Nocardia sp. NPDC050712 TaxID=3155518 RepID=UPI0033DD25FD
MTAFVTGGDAEHGADGGVSMIHQPGTLTVEVEDQREHGRILTIGGEVDILTAPQLARALDLAVAAHPSRILADLSGVLYMGAAGLTVLLRAHAAAGPHTVFAVIANGAAARPLRVTDVDSAFAVYPNRETALACTAAMLTPVSMRSEPS